jgi:hypothetical protein
MTGFCGLPWWWFPKGLTKQINNHTATASSLAPAATHTVKDIFFYIFKEDYPWAKLLELI